MQPKDNKEFEDGIEQEEKKIKIREQEKEYEKKNLLRKLQNEKVYISIEGKKYYEGRWIKKVTGIDLDNID
jgi:uncharacterized protein YebE (UPF0316 family)